MTSIKDLIEYGSHSLKLVGIEYSALESRILLSHVIGCSESYLIGHSEKELPEEIIKKFEALVIRRSNYEPIAYILEEKEFYGMGFKVTHDVLIPRSDTETLIDAVIKENSDKENLRILDLGVGSGCILITLLLELPNSSGVGVDISEQALNLAKQNASRHQVEERCDLILSDWFKDVKGKFDIIISNPPYIAQNETHLMARETLQYEPKLALFASGNGLENYRILASNAKNFMNPNCRIYVEIGACQKEKVEDIFIQQGFFISGQYKDLHGNVRSLSFNLA